MGRTIAERLSETAERSFVGREAEVGVLRRAIEADEPPFLVGFVHGAGGIGKSWLVRTAIGQASPAARPLSLDCKQIEPTSRGFLAALGESLDTPIADPASAARELAASERRCVLALDTYETFGLLDTWLRQTFLPQIPESVITLISGREPPSSAWLTTPGWQALFHAIELRGLTSEDALALLAARGLDQAQAERVNRFARGHPLALELAAAALRSQPELQIHSGPPAQILQELTRAFLDGLEPEVAEATRASSVMRRVTEPALEALIGSSAARSAFRELERLPFIDVTEEGLALHDLVRDTVASDLAVRDPARHRRYQHRAWQYLSVNSCATIGLGLWRQTADLLFLVQNPAVRSAFFPEGASEFTVAPATTADRAGVMAIAADTEPPMAVDLIDRWWKAHPRSFHVAKDALGGAAAFYSLIEACDVDAGLLTSDPIVVAWSEHLRREPVAEGERVLFLRRWLGRGTGEALTPQVASCWLDVKRAYMEMRPNLARLYTVVRDPGGYPYGALSLLPLADATIGIDGVAYHTLMLEFGDASVDGWLARMIGVELGAGDPDEAAALPEGTVTIMFTDIVDSTALTERLGDAEFRAMARTLEAVLRSSIGATGGAVVEGMLLGDGVMAVFTSARQAIECGSRSAAAARETGLEIRVGLHSGDVIRDGNNVFGGAVNLAARVAGLASPGEVLVSETVRALARTSGGVRFDDRGEHRLKGVGDLQRVHAVIETAAESATA